MTTTSKSTLRSVLGQTELIDPHGLSPFVALHLGEADRVHVRRTGAIGYVETDDAPPLADDGWTFVAFTHLQDCLRFIESDDVEIGVLPHGGVSLRAVASTFDTELRVHTVPRNRSGFKAHNPGAGYVTLDPAWLGGLNVKPFSLSTQPVLDGPKIILMTASGLLVWQATYDPGVPSYPRESFLKAVSGMTEGTLELTENGFYHAHIGSMHIYTAGHQLRSLATGQLNGLANDEAVELPAGRLVQALKAATALAATGASVQINPRTGVTTKDQYSNPARFSLGDVQPFPGLAVSVKTAKFLADALEQPNDEQVSLAQVVGAPDIFRFTRGVCEATVRSVPAY